MNPVTIVAPHPDDEVFGVGGLIYELAAARCPMRLVAVTDGEAAHGSSTPTARAELIATRVAERSAALAALGALDRIDVVRLQLPDGRLADHEDDLADALVSVAGSILLTTWRRDGHPDHEATGRATAVAARRRSVPLVEYTVWAEHRGRVERADRVRRLPLHPAARAAKCRAVRCFASQLAPSPDGRPVVPASLVRRLMTADEAVVSPEPPRR